MNPLQVYKLLKGSNHLCVLGSGPSAWHTAVDAEQMCASPGQRKVCHSLTRMTKLSAEPKWRSVCVSPLLPQVSTGCMTSEPIKHIVLQVFPWQDIEIT